MPKWKLQAVEPSTCEPIIQEFRVEDPIEGPKVLTRKFRGCRYIEMYDILLPRPQTIFIAGVERICSAHAVSSNAAMGKLRWSDGNWKDAKKYIVYQREWFLWLNNQQWKARVAAGMIPANEPMPPQIAGFNREPATAGSVDPPPQEEQDDLDTIYRWNREHNDRYLSTIQVAGALRADLNREAVSWHFEGHGDSRLLFAHTNQLTRSEALQLQASLDIQAGLGKVVVEG